MEYLFLILPGFLFMVAKAFSDASFFELPDQWMNKYAKDPESGLLVPAPNTGLYGWYHRLFGLKYRERFLFSATALVKFTDPWHWWESVMITILQITVIGAALLIAPFSWWWLLWLALAFYPFNNFLLNRARRYYRKRK